MKFHTYRGFEDDDWGYNEHGRWNFRVRGHRHDELRDYLALVSPSDPREADFHVVPLSLDLKNWNDRTPRWDIIDKMMSSNLFPRLQYFEEQKSRHIFFQTGDNCETLAPLHRSIVFKESLYVDSRSLPLPYTSSLDPSMNRTKIDDCPILVSFQGSITTYPPLRSKIEKSLRRIPGSFFLDTGNFFYDKDRDDRSIIAEIYAHTIDQSKFVLCPRGAGVNSIRFFETLAYGRIPIMISGRVKLPLPRSIKYRDFVIRIPEAEIEKTKEYIYEFLAKNDLSAASEKSRQAHAIFADMPRFLEASIRSRSLF